MRDARGGKKADAAMRVLAADLTDDVYAFLEQQTGERPDHRELVIEAFHEAFRAAYTEVILSLAHALETATTQA